MDQCLDSFNNAHRSRPLVRQAKAVILPEEATLPVLLRPNQAIKPEEAISARELALRVAELSYSPDAQHNTCGGHEFVMRRQVSTKDRIGSHYFGYKSETAELASSDRY